MMTSLLKVPGLSLGAFALFLACWLLFRGEEFVPSVDSEGAGATHLDARMSSPGPAVHADSAPGRMPLQRWVVQVLSREGEPLPGLQAMLVWRVLRPQMRSGPLRCRAMAT